MFDQAPRHSTFWLLIATILLAFALRLYRLDSQSLRGDEAASATYASFAPPKILEISREADPHPPLFYLVLHGWEALTGPSEFAVRYWVALAGVLAVPSIYALARLLTRSRIALVAAFLLAINSFHIWHSQDVRSYTWFVLVGLWSALFLVRWLQSRRWIDWGIYTLSLITLFYLHYYSLFLITFQGLYVVWIAVRGRSLSGALAWGGAVLLAGLAFLPWLSTSWQFIVRFTGDFDPAMPQTVLWRGLQAFSGGLVAETPRLAVGMIAIVALAAVGLWHLTRRHPAAALFLSLYLALPFLGIMILTLRGQAFTERYLIAALPAYLIIAAGGFVWLGERRERWAVAAALTGGLIAIWLNGQTLFAYHFDPTLGKSPEWRQLFDYIDRHHDPTTDLLIYNYPEAAVTYYLDTNWVHRADKSTLPVFLMPPERNPSSEKVAGWLNQLLISPTRVWFVPINGSGWDDAHTVETWLTRHGDEINAAEFHWIGTKLYLTPVEINRSMRRQPAAFADGIALRGFQVFATIPSEQTSGPNLIVGKAETLDLSLYWTAAGPTDVSLTVFTQLIDATGFRRGGQDNPPVWGTYPTIDWRPNEEITDQYRLTLEPDAPPGDYQIWIGLYNPETGQRVPILDQAGQPTTDHLVLNITITVEE